MRCTENGSGGGKEFRTVQRLLSSKCESNKLCYRTLLPPPPSPLNNDDDGLTLLTAPSGRGTARTMTSLTGRCCSAVVSSIFPVRGRQCGRRGGVCDTTPGLSGDPLSFDRVGVRMMSRVYLKDAINDYSHGHFFFNFTAKQVKNTRWIHHAGDGKKRRTEGGHVFLGTINVRTVSRRISISTCGDHGETEMTSSKPR